MDKDIFIIDCQQCGAKNRVREYSADKVPVCAKCKHPLVDEGANEAHARYAQNLNKFYNLPDMNAREPRR